MIHSFKHLSSAAFLAAILVALFVGGCSGESEESAAGSLPPDLFLAEAPAEARWVEEVRGGAEVGDEVAIRGRIGGSRKPFVDGRAVFTLIGSGIAACSDNPDDHCATPWDYCCSTRDEIFANSATIQVADASGNPLRVAVKGERGIQELSELVVVGRVASREGGALVVNAQRIYIVGP